MPKKNDHKPTITLCPDCGAVLMTPSPGITADHLILRHRQFGCCEALQPARELTG